MKEDSRMVSVIIPCYNGESVIHTSIASVFTQDYPSIELIVVDDGSTDGSKDAILSWEESFENKGFHLKYVFQDNRGLGGAIDTGLKHVEGEYLTLLDADDYFLPGSIAKRAAFLDNHAEYSGVRSNGWMIKGSEKIPFISSEKEKTETDYFHALFFNGATNWAGSYMVRTKDLFDFYPTRDIYPSRFGQNMQIILPVAYKKKFGVIDEPLMEYVLHENSLSQAASLEGKEEREEQNFYGYVDIYQHMIDSIISNPSEKKAYLDRVNSWRYRFKSEKALQSKDRENLKHYFDLLLSTGQATIGDKIKFYSILNPFRSIGYRIIRRLTQKNEKNGGEWNDPQGN